MSAWAVCLATLGAAVCCDVAGDVAGMNTALAPHLRPVKHREKCVAMAFVMPFYIEKCFFFGKQLRLQQTNLGSEKLLLFAC